MPHLNSEGNEEKEQPDNKLLEMMSNPESMRRTLELIPEEERLGILTEHAENNAEALRTILEALPASVKKLDLNSDLGNRDPGELARVTIPTSLTQLNLSTNYFAQAMGLIPEETRLKVLTRVLLSTAETCLETFNSISESVAARLSSPEEKKTEPSSTLLDKHGTFSSKPADAGGSQGNTNTMPNKKS